ncbi:MAG: metallophosphoesterase [Candidatus Omnitrophica bacterium]|nr:metallophosphoesterase [Candidatus Omnitrophota bacterium]
MMRIGVISDTHISVTTDKLPVGLLDALGGCDLILHAGDLIDLSVIEQLKKVSKVEAVRGNMDQPDALPALENKKTLNIAGKKICLMHGYGNPKKLTEVLKKEFLDQKPDIIVFGHSHAPMNQYIDGVLFFNPGSPTDTVFAPYRSYGIIEIDKKEINAKIYELK